MLHKKYRIFFGALALAAIFSACDNGSTKYLADPISNISSRCIQRSLGPNVQGEKIVVAYGMAIPADQGKLKSVKVVASIPGAAGTYIDPNSYFTNAAGSEEGVRVAENSVTNGNTTEAVFLTGVDPVTNKRLDTIAATLRYYYVIPKEAAGKSLTLTFTVTGTNGKSHEVKMGPYIITNMEITRDITLTHANACYLSIADMQAYDATQIAADPALAPRIDLVYGYFEFKSEKSHSFLSPSATLRDDPLWTGKLTKLTTLTNVTQMRPTQDLRDRHLSPTSITGVYVDEIDLLSVNFANTQDYYLRLRVDGGLWVETQDGKYRAYVFFNSTDDTNKKMVVSMKRLLMK